VAVGALSGYAVVSTGGGSNGAANVLLGYKAGYGITTGFRNVAIGSQDPVYSDPAPMMTGPVTGYRNVAIGPRTMVNLTSGYDNVAIGDYALNANNTGTGNTAIASSALGGNTTGSNNTALGSSALAASTTASYNTAIGYIALSAVTTGFQNTAVGYGAGNTITTGIVNTCIGNATASAASGSWQIVIGNQSGSPITGKGDSTGFINPNGGGVYQGNNSSSWSTASDRRLKKNIVDNNEGLDKISQIRVRNFEYRLPEEVDGGLQPTDAVNKIGVQLGVIAQELQEVCSDCVKEETTGVLSVDSDNVFWHMLNAIKQLNTRLQAAEAEIATLKGA